MINNHNQNEMTCTVLKIVMPKFFTKICISSFVRQF